MKTRLIKSILFLSGLSLLLSGCSSDDQPMPVNEEEVITTMTITLLLQGGGGTPVILQTRDLDGDGPNPPVVNVSGSLRPDKTYEGTIELLNETASPPVNITLEVEQEGDEHQFFFLTGGNLDIDTDYSDQDSNGQPLGLAFTVSAGAASSGTLTVVLRHMPNKDGAGVSEGDISNAAGETDVSEDFPLDII